MLNEVYRLRIRVHLLMVCIVMVMSDRDSLTFCDHATWHQHGRCIDRHRLQHTSRKAQQWVYILLGKYKSSFGYCSLSRLEMALQQVIGAQSVRYISRKTRNLSIGWVQYP